MIYKNLALFICIIFLSLIASISIITPQETDGIKDFKGKWKGSHNDLLVTLLINSDHTCNLELKNSLNEILETFSGVCNIDSQKYPNAFSIKNITNRSFSIYSLIRKVNKTTIQVTAFSTKWRLRDVSFTNENIINLSKII